MYRYDDIRQLHIEMTTRCNASCPLCSRNVLGGPVATGLPLVELSLEDVREILPREFIQQLELTYLCGNYGDPIVASDTLEVLSYLRDSNPKMKIGIYTNGSARNREYWSTLADLVDYCRFGIDGLKDTNHIYRRGTVWSKILESVSAFVSAGGRAEWDFIVFRHNEHQVDEARQLSKQLEFARFNAKRTARFMHPRNGRKLRRVRVLNRKGGVDYYLEEPVLLRNRNSMVESLSTDSSTYRDFDDYLQTTTISCKAALNNSIYVSAEGEVYPCCWTGMRYRWYSSDTVEHMSSLIDECRGGRAEIDGRSRHIRDIVEGQLFTELIPRAWSRGPLGTTRLKVCARVCGKQDMYASQSEEDSARTST